MCEEHFLFNYRHKKKVDCGVYFCISLLLCFYSASACVSIKINAARFTHHVSICLLWLTQYKCMPPATQVFWNRIITSISKCYQPIESCLKIHTTTSVLSIWLLFIYKWWKENNLEIVPMVRYDTCHSFIVNYMENYFIWVCHTARHIIRLLRTHCLHILKVKGWGITKGMTCVLWTRKRGLSYRTIPVARLCWTTYCIENYSHLRISSQHMF